MQNPENQDQDQTEVTQTELFPEPTYIPNPRPRGRPKGSKNRVTDTVTEAVEVEETAIEKSPAPEIVSNETYTDLLKASGVENREDLHRVLMRPPEAVKEYVPSPPTARQISNRELEMQAGKAALQRHAVRRSAERPQKSVEELRAEGSNQVVRDEKGQYTEDGSFVPNMKQGYTTPKLLR